MSLVNPKGHARLCCNHVPPRLFNKLPCFNNWSTLGFALLLERACSRETSWWRSTAPEWRRPRTSTRQSTAARLSPCWSGGDRPRCACRWRQSIPSDYDHVDKERSLNSWLDGWMNHCTPEPSLITPQEAIFPSSLFVEELKWDHMVVQAILCVITVELQLCRILLLYKCAMVRNSHQDCIFFDKAI